MRYGYWLPVTRPRPLIYAGGESEAAKQMIAAQCDAYLMHGDEPERVKQKIAASLQCR